MPSFGTTALGFFCLAAVVDAAVTNTELQTAFPEPSGTTNLPAVRTIAPGESFDGEMLLWDRWPTTCRDQAEGGDGDAVFLLSENATLSNAVIGPNNGEGIHCLGSCTINNVWFTDVCEDAITFKQIDGTSYVNGGGARNAGDKVLQHNGGGLVAVKNFFAQRVGKVYRSCGNCNPQYARHSTFENIRVVGANVVAGVNGNFGDVTEITNSCILSSGDVCQRFRGNANGREPTRTGSGADGTTCATGGIRTTEC